MSKQSIYLDDDFEYKIRAIAYREGRSISDVIRKRVEWSFKYEDKELSLRKLEDKMNAMYAVIDLLAGELAFVSGATQEATKSHEKNRLAGLENAEKIHKVTNFLKKSHFENNSHTDY